MTRECFQALVIAMSYVGTRSGLHKATVAASRPVTVLDIRVEAMQQAVVEIKVQP